MSERNESFLVGERRCSRYEWQPRILHGEQRKTNQSERSMACVKTHVRGKKNSIEENDKNESR